MKKKVLFMLISMKVGGTERAFLNLLDHLPKEEYDITLLLLQKKGRLYEEVPSHVKIKVMKEFKVVGEQISYRPAEKLKSYVSERQFRKAFFLCSRHAYMKLTKDRKIQFKKAFKHVPFSNEKYDIAVAYAGPMDIITYYIASKVNALKKYQWIHFDVNKIGFDPYFAKKMYRHFDQVFTVSEKATVILKENIPSLQDKIITKPNDIPVRKIQEFAEESDVFPRTTAIQIVTVGRLAEEKGPDLAVKTLRALINLNYNVTWHWVGEGEKRDVVEELIQEYGLEENFFLEGEQINPYPYIRQADIYVQPSKHEGYCITLAEARVLQKPIVSTATAGAKAQIKHEKTGLLTELNVQSLTENIIKLLSDKQLQINFSCALAKENRKRPLSDPFKISS